MRLHNSLALTPLCLSGALANFLGPPLPAPRDLSSQNSKVAGAWKNLTTKLEGSLHGHSNSTLAGLKDLTFSIGLFSSRDANAGKLQYHHAAPEIRNASVGTRKIDGDSIYRVASVSKLFTVYAGLIALDQADWERPLSEVFPEFTQTLRESSDSTESVYDTQWDEITPWALASQLGGVSQYGAPWFNDYLINEKASELLNTTLEPGQNPAIYALPPIDESDPLAWPPCATLESLASGCAPEDYLTGVASNPPIVRPWTTPVYSNNGLTLLGLAIANLTGKSIDDVYQESIFDPLELDSSYSKVPPESEIDRWVVAGPVAGSFALDNGLSTPSGGIYSTLNDLAKFGVGILNSTLLSSAQTRRWFKPITHTSNLHYSIGAPWEIYRWVDPSTGLVTDIYTKLGDSGNYGSISAYLPDFDAGFSVIAAKSDPLTRPAQTQLVIQQVANAVVPALFAQGNAELERNYAGTYVSTTEGLNSSITIAAPKRGAPGLVITNWISNGTDITKLVPAIFNAPTVDWEYRLRPAIPLSGESGQAVFRAASVPGPAIAVSKDQTLFTGFYQADDFSNLGQIQYGGQPLNQLVFDVGEDGDAVALTPAAWRVTLEKQ
ncbi:beta-lactamase/transpeptidase-like protein [Aspergillus karnatakaensis]|uniref:serine hydrolase domain-containing protein n=1 Tax=Aspergillus karnatakaensis TaxID=1810916 RepID=UPI003CCCE4B8